MIGTASSARQVNLRRLFEPQSVAVLGASENRAKPGGRPLAYLAAAGYRGRVYPINPRHAELFGWPAFPSIAALPEPPDLIVVAIPAAGVVQAVRDAAAAGAGAMVIYTSGFAETDDAGAAAEAEIRAIAAETGMVVCGPNCQGIGNLFNGLAVNFSSALSEGQPKPGPVGIVSQSGLVGALMASDCIARGLGIGYLVSTGNEAGFGLSDAIAWMAEDERIRTVVGYVEGVRDMPRFGAAAAAMRERGKPLVMLKVGRSPDGARVAASHTGSVAGDPTDFDVLAAAHGVVVADSIEDVVDAAATFAAPYKPAAGGRVAIFGNSGGFAVLCTDQVDRHGLAMAPLGDDTIEVVRRHVPPFIVPQNPVDLVSLPMNDPAATLDVLEAVAADPGVDILVCCFGAVRVNVEALTEGLAAFAARCPKPIVVAWLASSPAGAAILAEAGIPVFADPSRAVRAVRRLVDLSADAPAHQGEG